MGNGCGLFSWTPVISDTSDYLITFVADDGEYADSLDVVITVSIHSSCCHGFTGNTNCDADEKRNLSDITKLIDHVYLTRQPLCCYESGNTNGDPEGKINLSDITRLIDHVYISKQPTAPCP